MKQNIVLTALAILCCTCALRTQQPPTGESFRGAKPAAANPVLGLGDTWALVVGISNYQNQTDLHYAHRDAGVFVQYLRSPAGGSVDEARLKVLINEDATMANFAMALDELLERVNPGDFVIIYFSGHGDVETRLSSKPGYLLCWDAPSRVYTSGGAYNVRDLQDFVTTLSSEKMAKIALYIDACHSGSLAGGSTGASITNETLAKQFARETKILSCQSNELSLESSKYGGGRGLFSFHLINGLYGEADQNNDQVVTLHELDRYLNEWVPKDADPNPQYPVSIGSKTEKLSVVNAETLAMVREAQNSGAGTLGSVTGKGLEAFFTDGDSVPRARYEAFQAALLNKQFFEPRGACADDLYAELMADNRFDNLRGVIKRNYAAALLNDAQTAVNEYLVASPDELRRRWQYDNSYAQYPRCIGRAAELLGEQHYLYDNIQVQEYYFTGLNLRLEGEREKDNQLFTAAGAWQYKALAIDSSAAHVYNELGLLAQRLEDYGLSVNLFKKAIALSPKWVLPWANMCGSFVDADQYDEAIETGLKAIELNDSFALAHYNLGVAYRFTNNPEKARYHMLEAQRLDPEDPFAYYQLGDIYLKEKDFPNAEKMFRIFAERVPADADGFFNLGLVSDKQDKAAEALTWYLKALEVDSQYHQARLAAGWSYIDAKQYGAAEAAFNTFLQQLGDKTSWSPYYGLACIFSVQNKPTQALDNLERAFQKGFDNLKYLNGDARMNNIRKHPRYKQLLLQYFNESR
jgi:tetratricopeptide (TPR) repeat protein